MGGAERRAQLTGDDTSLGYNLGFTYKPMETTEIGVHYRSAISHDLEGYQAIGGINHSAGSAGLDLPDILTIGAAHDLNDKLTLQGQFTWFGWNRFDAITAISNTGTRLSQVQQEYDNTIAIAVGAEYDYSDAWTLRAGYQFDETPTTDEYRTTRTPDGDRQWLTVGATYNVSDKVAIDMAAAYINVAKEDINLSRNGSTIRATNEADIGIFSLGFNYKF